MKHIILCWDCEIVEANIINLFGFTLQYNNSKWGENFIQDHFNYTFDELE